MAQKEKSYKSQKKTSSFIVNLVLILISAVFVVPIFGILITSFRQSERIFNSVDLPDPFGPVMANREPDSM